MTWLKDFVDVGNAAEARAAAETCECGTQKAVGYSNVGIPIVVCPSCQPSLYANRKRSVGDAFGFPER